MEEKFCSIREASDLTGISERKIRRWCRLGTIKHAKPGKREYRVVVRDYELVYLNIREGIQDGI
jgi:excisionase family DNA binding protein